MKYNLSKIRAKTAYSTKEVSILLEVNRKTVLRWIQEGLPLLDFHQKLRLIMGYDLKAFIQSQRDAVQVKLQLNEFYCFSCRKAVIARRGSEKVEKTGKKIGKADREQKMLCGICKECGGNIARFL
ncbi:MAG: hypothetical protein WC882_04115 [Candidatus Gracilibacteria bacterium]